MNVVVAFDPGGTTGYCAMTSTGKCLKQGELTGSDQEQTSQVRRILFPYRQNAFVVIESYRIFPSALQQHTYSQVQPVQMIGRIKALCEELGIQYKEQPPSLKKFFTAPRLRHYGVCPPKKPHAQDAARHALYYLVFKTKTVPLPKE